MKILSLSILAFFFLTGRVAAQIDKEDIAIAQSIFGKTKRVIVDEYLKISIEKNNNFWVLYDSYEEKRKAISRQRYELLKKYADNYATLNDQTASKLALGYMANDKKTNKLNKVYFKRFKREIGGLKAATLFQIETYIITAVHASVQSEIPVIGELEKLQYMKP
ncbi:hypothetical protein [Dyadobacter psychrotolerans]|uniref:Uncharacterized protein n=1 Tax=Dyadobacter psychrotolerans TaxID=2541721 RepID=A0A4R5DFT7_9BACT|nr:hypothetical protein [Dyadobacter psychrotolerans]TDE10761.1 hypothetical protein E0F88_27185 [Dyadobacter psychrotolerans]